MSGNETLSLKKGDSPRSMSSTVTVCSKLPMGFILKLYDQKKMTEPVMGGGAREYTMAVFRRNSKTYTINGNSYAQNKGPHCQIEAGYAITRDIPKDFWDEWLSQNEHAEYVVNGMIFAHAESASAIAQAKDGNDVRSNLERLDPGALHKRGLAAATQN